MRNITLMRSDKFPVVLKIVVGVLDKICTQLNDNLKIIKSDQLTAEMLLNKQKPMSYNLS